VRKYVPELKGYDKKYIYEPWKAPIADQKKWGCRVVEWKDVEGEKGTYPKPMLEFGERREVCIQGMKNAYHIGLYGNDPKVLDGTWRKLFDDKAEGPTEGSKGPPGAMVEHEDADGGEEVDAPEPMSPKKAKRESEKSEKKAGMDGKAKHKREASQGTLDGMVTRKKKVKKEDEVAPNETHFG
jgi:hypothetical protein